VIISANAQISTFRDTCFHRLDGKLTTEVYESRIRVIETAHDTRVILNCKEPASVARCASRPGIAVSAAR
jgi:hypothetical protein